MNNIKGYISYNFKDRIINAEFNIDRITLCEGLTIVPYINKNDIYEILQIKLKPEDNIVVNEVYLEFNKKYNKNDYVFVNGYESWTDSREYKISEKIACINNYFKSVMGWQGDYWFYKYSGKKGIFHSFTYTYVKNNELYEFYGSLNEKTGFTIFEHDYNKSCLKIIKDCQGIIINKEYDLYDILLTTNIYDKVFDLYFDKMGIEAKDVELCTGWTSWYNYFNKISEEILLKNLDNFFSKRIPIDVFQIDDGYQKAVGDWLITNEKFPKGMKYIADRIKEKGFQPGIWVAPFICEKKSDIYKYHKDWLLRDEYGDYIRAGYSSCWSGEYYALDIYNSEVRNYLKEVFYKIVVEWGYEFLKLDFLYAVCINNRKDKSRAEIMYDAVDFIKEISYGSKIIGCGVPLSAAFGKFEYCRIGSDVAPFWEDDVLKKLNFRERTSTVNSLVSTIGRSHLNLRAFLNDPDVFILRSKNNKLNENERYTLFVLNLVFGGLIFTSDNIDEYNDKEYYEYCSMFPYKHKKIKSIINKDNLFVIKFSIEQLNYIIYSNFRRQKVNIKLENKLYFIGKEKKFIYGGEIELNPHETICLLEERGKDFEIIGSVGHVFPGSEISKFIVDKNNFKIDIDFEEKFLNKKFVYIKVPSNISQIEINGKIFSSQGYDGYNIVCFGEEA